MSEEDYQKMLEFLKQDGQRKLTKEEALQTFVNAGILDKDGNFTDPYKALEKYRQRQPTK